MHQEMIFDDDVTYSKRYALGLGIQKAPTHLHMGEHSLHTRHDILQMLLFQASGNDPTCPAPAFLRLVRIFSISASRHWRVSIAVIRLRAIAIDVARARKTIHHAEVGLFAAAGARWAKDE
jgi:hypothetical protein